MALMPNARARRRGQAPQPRSGAPQAQGLTATPRSAARSGVPSLAIRHAKSLSSTKAVAPQAISATQRIYTSLTGTTFGHRLRRLTALTGVYHAALCH